MSLMYDVSAVHRTLGQWRHTFTEGGENVPEEGPGKTAVAQATLVMHQTESVMDFLEDWHGQTKDDGLVGWVECAQLTQGTTWRLVRSPLQVGELLDRYLARFRAMVFTSATLAVNGHFDFFLERTGLGTVPEHPVQTALIHSPFDYAEHLRLYVPKSPVNRSKGSPSELERQTAAQVTAMCEELGGGMLVLFNSIRELKNVGKAVRPKLEKNRQLLLVQFVDGTRQALSQEFRDDGEAVLFGTRSFFEGLDFKGDALRTLVLAKLPFPYLKEPVIEARMRALAQDGRDPNHSYYHPMAIFLLRQAVGRVIRSHTDRGVVFLLDDRLLTKNYGRRFLDNLPQCPVSTGTLEELLQEAREFLGRETGADVATTPL